MSEKKVSNNSTASARLRLEAKLFKGFADATRLAILEALRQGDKTVSQIVEETGFSQPNVSNHLGYLRYCPGDGRHISWTDDPYSLRDDRVGQALDLGQELLLDISKETYQSLLG